MAIDHLLEELKPLGRYQIWTLIYIVMARSLINMITFLPILSTGDQDYFCVDDYPEYSSNLTSWPTLNVTQCARDTNVSKCSAWLFDDRKFKSTIRSQFLLICGREYLAELSTTLYFIGCLLGDFTFGFLSDRYGRRRIMLVSSSLLFLFSTGAAFAPNYYLYCLARMIAGAGDGGTLNSAFTLLSESTSSKYAVHFTFVFYQGWSLGILLVSLIGYFVRNHVILQIALSLPQVLIPVLCLTVHESLRWLISNRHFKRADEVALSIARRNGVKLADNFTVKKYITDAMLSAISLNDKDSIPHGQFSDVFKYPRVLRASVIVWFGWFVGAFGCYVTSLGVSMLGWQLYPVLALSSAVEIPARFTGSYLARTIGRVRSVCVGLGVSGILCLVNIAFLDNPALSVCLIVNALIAKFWITLGTETLQTYTAELFPTCMRNTGVSTGCACTRMGAMLAPLVLALNRYWKPLPFLLLGILPIFTTSGLIFMPDTRGHALIERIDQFDAFLTNHRRRLHWMWNKGKDSPRRCSFEDGIDLEIRDSSSEDEKVTIEQDNDRNQVNHV